MAEPMGRPGPAATGEGAPRPSATRRRGPAAGLDALRSAAGLDVPPPAPGVRGDPGLFGPASTVWRIGRERALLLAGPAALLLQVAHPLIAEAVARHSGFRNDPYGRLRATLDATLSIAFGDMAQVRAAADRVRATHRGVAGALPAPVGPYPKGTPYRARDPDLALWVHATLVRTALDAYDRFVRPLEDPEREAYHREARPMAALFGAAEPPGTHEDFLAYLRRAEDALHVGEVARAIAREVLAPPLPRAARASLPVTRAVTAGLLGPRLASAFGLRFGLPERLEAAALARTVRGALRLAPAGVRFWPHYLVARDRIRA